MLLKLNKNIIFKRISRIDKSSGVLNLIHTYWIDVFESSDIQICENKKLNIIGRGKKLYIYDLEKIFFKVDECNSNNDLGIKFFRCIYDNKLYWINEHYFDIYI